MWGTLWGSMCVHLSILHLRPMVLRGHGAVCPSARLWGQLWGCHAMGQGPLCVEQTHLFLYGALHTLWGAMQCPGLAPQRLKLPLHKICQCFPYLYC